MEPAMDTDDDPTPEPMVSAPPTGPALAPTPAGPVLVYSPDRPYRLELYLQQPGPGVEPLRVAVPRGLAIMTPEDWRTCREQARFCEQVQTVGWEPSPGQLPPTVAAAWAGIPRKQAVAMLGRTRDVATLEQLLELQHHLDVRGAIATVLGEVRPARGRRQ